MKLSKRLEMVASFVGIHAQIADVGTDHGYIPIVLVEQKLVAKAIAMDIKPGPLERAREHIRQHGLQEKIETRLSDGVKQLSVGEADTVIIAGMGGELVIHILEEGKNLWNFVEHWILSPQSELDKVRKYLIRQGFEIVKENMVKEDGKYYTVMDVVHTPKEKQLSDSDRIKQMNKRLSEAEYYYGPILIKEKNPVLIEFLEKEKGQLTGIIQGLEEKPGERSIARREQLEKKLGVIGEILDMVCCESLANEQKIYKEDTQRMTEGEM